MTWDSEPWRQARDAKLREWLGDEDAMQALVTISAAVELWDDLIDGDPVDHEVINATMFNAMVSLGFNPWWRAHQDRLLPIMQAAVLAWLDSNAMRGGDLEDRRYAYVLRNMGLELVLMGITICRGFGYARQVSVEVRRFFRHETFEEWDAEGNRP